jgi:hypothetical protein
MIEPMALRGFTFELPEGRFAPWMEWVIGSSIGCPVGIPGAWGVVGFWRGLSVSCGRRGERGGVRSQMESKVHGGNVPGERGQRGRKAILPE